MDKMFSLKCCFTTYILCAMASLAASAQSIPYKPMLQKGKVWYERYIYPPRGFDMFGKSAIATDTIVDGKSCFAFKYTGSTMEDKDLVWEADGKVYGLSNNDFYGMNFDNHGLYYDFTLGKGDTTIVFGGGAVKVVRVDTIMVDGESYRRFEIRSASDQLLDFPEYWVEGIGSNWGFYPCFRYDTFGSEDVVDSCTVDGRLVFMRNDFVRVPHSSRQWVIQNYGIDHCHAQPYLVAGTQRNLATIGERELLGYTWEKVYECSEPRGDSQTPDQRYKYLFLMRSEDGRVLAEAESYRNAFPDAATVYPENGSGEVVLYDYNAQLGDSYLGHDTITVVAQGDTLLSDGQQHRTLTLSTGHQLVEGIGCVNTGYTPFDYLCHPVTTHLGEMDGFELLENYYDAEGHRVYVKSREQVYDALVAGIQTVTSANVRTVDDAVYDLQGRRVAADKLPKGIYVRQGRKFVVR